VQLTPEDTAFLRNNFSFRRMKAFDNMAPDLQIMASDAQSLAAGDWKLLVAEIHPDFTSWQHCFFAWCPDPAGYAKDYSRQGGQAPNVVIGRHPPYFVSAHITLCIFPYSRDWTFVGVPGPEGAETLRSAETLVEVTADDILLLHSSGRVLGSLLHTWNTAVNTHRLELHGRGNHSPRLQVGRAIVQRENWTVQPDDQVREAVKSGGQAAYSALRRFRKQHLLPETAFVRGCLPRLNFHKDAKPVFVDFRNPLLMEMLSKTVDRFRKLTFTEMLPRLEDCWLQGPGGRYSCEFRTLVVAERESGDMAVK
jgi:hypothetical protein